MNVVLLDFTGANAPDPARYAAEILVYAKNTRLTQGEELRTKIQAMSEEEVNAELSAIIMSVRSSWEFVDYTFQIIGVTRAFTHQLVRTRTASYAQQAMRVADMADFEALMPQSIEEARKTDVWNGLMRHIREAYKEFREADIPAQDARAILPTNVLTNIIVKMNLRTLADLVGKRDNLRAQDEYQQVIREMTAYVLEVHPWAEGFLYPERTHTPALNDLLREQLGSASPVDKPKLNQALKELDALKATWG